MFEFGVTGNDLQLSYLFFFIYTSSLERLDHRPVLPVVSEGLVSAPVDCNDGASMGIGAGWHCEAEDVHG